MHKMVDHAIEMMLDSYHKLEHSYKADVKEKVLDEHTNPFVEPINLKNMEKHLEGIKKTIFRVKKGLDSVVQKDLGSISQSLTSSTVSGMPESRLTVNLPSSETPEVSGIAEKYEKLKDRYKHVNKKYKEKSDRLREVEFQCDKATKENERLKAAYKSKMSKRPS